MKFYSLHIGLNSVDATHYQGWSGDLNACEADAQSLQQLVVGLGHTQLVPPVAYNASILLTKQATRAAVLAELKRYAQLCQPGDLFLLTYSGHGGQLPDLNSDESDGQDETWVLYDAQLVDDELYLAYSQFSAGVRIFILSDSCHSGSVNKLLYYAVRQPVGHLSGLLSNLPDALGSTGQAPAYRNMPTSVAQQTFNANRAFYEPILRGLPKPGVKGRTEQQVTVEASVRLISGCADNQLSQDGTFNGLFTGTLLRVWNGGTFQGDYQAFHQAILAKMPPDQTPQHSLVGTVDTAYDKLIPFTATVSGQPSQRRPVMRKAGAPDGIS